MGEVMGPQMHQGGWTNKKGGGSRHSLPSQFPRITPLSERVRGRGRGVDEQNQGKSMYIHIKV